MRHLFVLLIIFSFGKISAQTDYFVYEKGRYSLTIKGASHLAALPLKCIEQEFPYKTGIVFSDSSFLKRPKNYHPAFYGCFDWHSTVHGHWMLVKLIKLFPGMPEAPRIREVLQRQLSREHIQQELAIFSDKNNRSFERSYGWAWLLQLQNELLTWDDEVGRRLAANLQPLADHFASSTRDFLGKLLYPIRVGEHSNLAFGLRLIWDYAALTKDDSLKQTIRRSAMQFFSKDMNCPLDWEPGGTDFLSPCLEEADLMRRILPATEYRQWLKKFLPRLFSKNIKLAVGEVKDRTDGRLVHLDGLNFSRSWCVYGIARHIPENREVLVALADMHMKAALPHVASGDYMGEHWLASFAVYALTAER